MNPLKRPYRRKTLILNPEFQIRFGLYIVTLNLAAAAVLIVLYVKWLVSHLVDVLASAGLEGHPVLADVQVAGAILLSSLLALNILSFFLSLKHSHRIIGPIFRFERHAKDILEGKTESRIKLRDGDYFQELAGLLNQISEKIESLEKTGAKK